LGSGRRVDAGAISAQRRKGGRAVDVYSISDTGIKQRYSGELEQLLTDPDGLTWVDMPICQAPDAALLSDVFGFRDIAVRDCLERNHVSKLHVYDDHAFTVLHAPELGRSGHVHYVELDQFLGPNYLVTIHGPLNPAVKPEVASLDTGRILRRLEEGHLHPQSPFELSAAIVSALTRREIDLVAALAEKSGRLEQRVMLGELQGDPEPFLEELFKVWYELLAIRTMAAHSSATYGRMAKLARFLPEREKPLVADLADRFDLVRSMADGQKEFLHGVIEFYQTRTGTHMTLAAEKLAATSLQQSDDMRRITAWVAVIAVPTAITGFFGQNVPYPGFGSRTGFIASILLMATVAVVLYISFKRRKWL
jgi:Mg2+ and Co2+ transporter CorA